MYINPKFIPTRLGDSGDTRALKSPPSGEQINADAHAGTGSGTPAISVGPDVSSAPTTAPQAARSGASTATNAPETGQSGQPAAVPDDPVEVLDRFFENAPKSATSSIGSQHKYAVRALAAHYEAKGMRRAAEICRSRLGSLGNFSGTPDEIRDREAKEIEHDILKAAKEADRWRRSRGC